MLNIHGRRTAGCVVSSSSFPPASWLAATDTSYLSPGAMIKHFVSWANQKSKHPLPPVAFGRVQGMIAFQQVVDAFLINRNYIGLQAPI